MNSRRTCVPAMIVALALVGVATIEASGRFSRRSLRGTYGFYGSGTLAGGTVQAGIVGLNSFDGAGGCDVTVRLNAGGTVIPLTAAECSYTVNADGTGQIHVRFDHPVFAGPFTSDFVIVDNAKEVPFSISEASGARSRPASPRSSQARGRTERWRPRRSTGAAASS
jgi:hypothetical protein